MGGARSILEFPIRGNKISMRVEAREHILSRQTPFQQIDVFDTEALGRVLLLDGHVQLSQLDEHAYHESLIHIPLLSIANPRRVLVIGGGDGGVLREIVRHKGIRAIDLVEIDQAVIEVSREYLPEVSGEAFEDPRVHVFIEDAFHFVSQTRTPYDLIVMDVTDVYENEAGGLSEQLFTRDYYVDCANALSEAGFLVTQADNHVFCPYSLRSILAMFSSVFARVGCYQAVVPSFGGMSAFAWASKGVDIVKSMPYGTNLDLRYLNEVTYRFAFDMPDFAG